MSTWRQRWYQELDKGTNRYLALPGRATLGQAFALLRSPDIDGAAYWHLVVARTDGSWAFAQFSELFEYVQAEGEAALDTRLDTLQALQEVGSDQMVDLSTLAVRAARRRADSSPGHLLLVREEQQLAGILYVGTLRSGGATVSTSALNQLAGRYADLSEFSDELIEPRRPTPAEPPDEEDDQGQEEGG